jgi:long-chain acyl-CoA synthetase
VEPLLSQLEGIHSAGHALVRSEAEALTLSCLAERSRALSALIERLGLRVVALHMDNRPDWLVIDLACQLASVCLVPLPTFFSEEQLRHVLDSIPVDGIFTDRSDLVAPWCAGRIRPTPELAVGAFELLRLDPPPDAGALPDGTGKVTFTSGSTGRPKGVCLGDAQLLAQAGGEVMIPTLAEVGFEGSSTLNPQVLLNLLTRHRPNSLILTPQLLQILVAAARNGWMPPSELRFVAVGGAKVPGGLLEAAHVLGIPAFEGYGLSECASVVSLNLPGSNRPGSCGKPLPQLQVEIVDGEICVSGNAMLGYAGEPHSWGQGRIASGDLGYLDDDGFLVINGRRKNLLISSFGRNISPEWVESEALASGTLAECVVFGDARPFCVALISPRDPQACDETIQQSLDRSNAHLPDYARIRRWFRLPSRLADCAQMLTQNGRPRRQAIATRFDETIDGLYSGHSLTDGPFARTA